MKEILFADLQEVLAPCPQALLPQPRDRPRPGEPLQSSEAYRFSRPSRQTARRKAVSLPRIGALPPAQERIATATAESLAVFFALPVRSGEHFAPASFPSFAIREHPLSGHPQL